jgi:hypothetical protein
MVPLAQLDLLALTEQTVQQAQLETRVLMGQQAQREMLVLMVRQAQPDLQAQRAQLDLPAQQVRLVLLRQLMAQLAQLVHR